MKKVLILFLAGAFLFSLAGCTPKSEYDKLLDEKAAVQRKLDDMSSKKVNLDTEVAARKKEIKELKTQVSTLNTKSSSLEKQLASANAKIKSLQR